MIWRGDNLSAIGSPVSDYTTLFGSAVPSGTSTDSEQFVDIIDKLEAIPEADGSGTLFDKTLIAWCRDMGDAPNHNQNSMWFVLASGDGG